MSCLQCCMFTVLCFISAYSGVCESVYSVLCLQCYVSTLLCLCSVYVFVCLLPSPDV